MLDHNADLIAARLVELRLSRGEKQREFAAQIRVSVNTISFWETGKHRISTRKLVIVARTFGVSIDWLLGASVGMEGGTELDIDLIAQAVADEFPEGKSFYEDASEFCCDRNIDIESIRHWAAGRCVPMPASLIELCAWIGCSAEEMMRRDG